MGSRCVARSQLLALQQCLPLGGMASMAGEVECMEQYGPAGTARRANGRDGPYGPVSAPAPAAAAQA
eukprot:5386796-Alexandrium_andersonii.AAC.1